MSRIDTTKPFSTSPALPGPSAAARGSSRVGTPAPVDASLVRETRPPLLEGGHDNAHDQGAASGLPSIGAVTAADVEAIAAMSGEQLLAELARIDLLVTDRLRQTDDPAMQGSLKTGLAMLGETLRRLRLVHGGHDALVLNR